MYTINPIAPSIVLEIMLFVRARGHTVGVVGLTMLSVSATVIYIYIIYIYTYVYHYIIVLVFNKLIN